MALLNKHSEFATAFGLLVAAMLLLGGQAHAQSSQDMSLLSDQERKTFSERLQHSSTSSERARITAEMNRLVQQRRMEQRRAQNKADANANNAMPKGPASGKAKGGH